MVRRKRKKPGDLSATWQTDAELHARAQFEKYQRLAVKWWDRVLEERKRTKRILAKWDAAARDDEDAQTTQGGTDGDS